MLFGDVYNPVDVIVPEEADPPATPSTDQITLVLLAVNCCVCVNVNVATCGLIPNPAVGGCVFGVIGVFMSAWICAAVNAPL